jgi:NAD(P)H-hydrate epimerase
MSKEKGGQEPFSRSLAWKDRMEMKTAPDPFFPHSLRPLAREEVRRIDALALEEFGLSTIVLMENAGRGAAALLRERLGPNARVLILCGPGNNGGDGGVVARHLDNWGVSVRVVWLAEPEKLRGDAATQWKILNRSQVEQTSWSPGLLEAADWVVDGLFGTGLTRPLEGQAREVVEAVNRSGKPVLALDIPSGLDADSGEPLGEAVRARLTATFVAPKLGFSRPGASSYVGEVVVVEIGVPRVLLARFEGSA